METESIKITSTKHLASFAEHHRARLHLPEPTIPEGTKCWLERNARTELQEATIIGYHVDSTVDPDYSGVGKYMSRNSFATVKRTLTLGTETKETWPLTMIYFEK